VSVEKLARREVCKVPPYEYESIFPLKLSPKIVKLDLNENLVVDRKFIRKLFIKAFEDIDVRLYSPPHGVEAAKAISRFLELDESEVYVGNGGDDVLDAIMKTFMERGDEIVVVEPTFYMFDYFTQVYGLRKVEAQLRQDFSLDVDEVLRKCGEKTKLIVVCSPNNPTGKQFEKSDVRRILEGFNGLVIVDEAYVEFGKYTVSRWIREFSNLIVLRTFSKAFSLAGIRVGYFLSNRKVVDYTKRVTPPHNVNFLAQRMVALALKNWSYFKRKIDYVKKERDSLFKELSRLSHVAPYPSDGNFILFRINKPNVSSSTIKSKLKEYGVLVKDKGDTPLLSNCLRVTIGTHKMNSSFLSALKKSLAK